MLPTLEPGDRLLTVPLLYGSRLSAFGLTLPGFRKPDRGDIVVVRPPYVRERSFVVHAADAVVSFFTARRVSVLNNGNGEAIGRWTVKRVIGVPGDTVRVEDNVAYVRIEGNSTFVPEFSTARRDYSLDRTGLPDGWAEGFPLSGNLAEVSLGPGEYFVLGDNRVASLDSRHWGSVSESAILTPAVLRYWPLQRFGRP
jgi:signal peptidase I